MLNEDEALTIELVTDIVREARVRKGIAKRLPRDCQEISHLIR
jgi:hypothetical protein